MKTKISYIFSLLLMLSMALGLASCNSKNPSALNFDGDTYVNTLTLDSYEAIIDNVAKTITVGVPFGFDPSAMKLTSLTLSEGAKADIVIGEVLNCTVPRNIRITNGDVFTDYTITVKEDDAYFMTFIIDNKYPGTIDNVARAIRVFVPMDADLTSMLVSYSLNEGATAEPGSNTIVDFTKPVVFTATCRTAVIKYTVTVIPTDLSQEPKAFIGNGDLQSIGDEAKAAADWMMQNVPNSTYVNLQDILNGNVKLSNYKMIWCHFDWDDWPGIMWDTRDFFNDYYIKGGNILASRDGARYINDVWRISRVQLSPNNMYGGAVAGTLADDFGFCIAGHETHPLYANLPVTDSRILLVSGGCSNTNRTLQWGVDWEPYFSMEEWEVRTGAKALAQDHDGDINRCTIAEFAPREVLKGYQSGTVITVGTPAYEWYQAVGENRYRSNLEQLTKNAINYLCK